MATDKNITEKTDLLGFLPDRGDVGNPAQYLRADDFVTQPETTNAEYYPSKNEPVQFGTSAAVGRYAGHPLFSGSGSLPPYAIVDARARAIQHASIAQKLRDQQKAADANKNNMYYQRPDNLPLAYNEDFQNVARDRSMQYWTDAVKYYGGSSKLAQEDLQNPNGKFGKAYNDFNQNIKTYAENVDAMSEMTKGVRKLEQEDKIVVPPAMEETLKGFESGEFGKLDEHDPVELKQRFQKMQIMNNMLPQYNAFVNRIQKSELPNEPVGRYKAKPGYITSAVDPVAAKEEAVKTINSGAKSSWAFIAGLKPDATVDEIADKLSKDAVNQHGVQYKPLPEHPDHKGAGWGNGEFTNDRFAVRPTVKDAAGQMKEGSGYEVQDLTANENSFKEVWQAPYALSADSKKLDSKFSGEVQGAFTGVKIARNPDTKKLEWYAVITEPSVTSTDKSFQTSGYLDKKGSTVSTPSVTPPLTHLIPYSDVAGKIEAYTADKKGTGGFKLQQSDISRVDEMNKHLPGKTTNHPLPSGKPASVKQNGVVYTWNSQSGKYE